MNNLLHKRTWIIAEFAAIFLILPYIIKLNLHSLKNLFFPILFTLAAYGLYYLFSHSKFDRKKLWITSGWKNKLLARLLTFILSSAVLIGCVYIWLPEYFFKLPPMWLAIMVAYPLLSVTTQEIVFRSFFFQRYQQLFKNEHLLFWVSVFVFGWAHIFFGHWFVILLSTMGGYLFAKSYKETDSLAVAWLEHSLYGCMLFTIGLGDFFYHGSQEVLGHYG